MNADLMMAESIECYIFVWKTAGLVISTYGSFSRSEQSYSLKD